MKTDQLLSQKRVKPGCEVRVNPDHKRFDRVNVCDSLCDEKQINFWVKNVRNRVVKCKLFPGHNGSTGSTCAKPGWKGVKPVREKALLPRFNDLPLCTHRSSLYNDFCTTPTQRREKNMWDLMIYQDLDRAFNNHDTDLSVHRKLLQYIQKKQSPDPNLFMRLMDHKRRQK